MPGEYIASASTKHLADQHLIFVSVFRVMHLHKPSFFNEQLSEFLAAAVRLGICFGVRGGSYFNLRT